MRSAVYWQTWSTKWCAKSEDMDLYRELDPRVQIVYLAFSTATHNYTKGKYTLEGTGLQFSQDFAVVKGAIQLLKQRGVTVMLSVGGGSYPFNVDTVRPEACVALAADLGVDGIDMDWEPAGGVSDAWQFAPLISGFRKALWPGAKLSAAVWSIGAADPARGGFSGMNREGLKTQGRDLDWINIMAYDAGDSYDAIAACRQYREVYAGPMHMGFEVGTQGWGGALLKMDEVVRGVAWISQECDDNGMFIWAYQKESRGTPSVAEILVVAASAQNKPQQPPQPDKSSPPKMPLPAVPRQEGVKMGACKHCGNDVYLGIV